jgi:hypothetical protein
MIFPELGLVWAQVLFLFYTKTDFGGRNLIINSKKRLIKIFLTKTSLGLDSYRGVSGI